MSILNNYLIEDVLKDKFNFSESGIYYSPKTGSLEYYREIIEKFPLFESPEVFGMHENANIAF